MPFLFFAAVLSGSGIIQFFTAIGFNFLATTFMTMLTYYFSAFLFGYVTGDSMQALITSLSPFTGLTNPSVVTPVDAVDHGLPGRQSDFA